MDQKIKNYLGIAIIGILITSTYGILSFVRSYATASETSSFSTSAEGKMIAIPDIAQFSFSVITQGGVNLQNTQSENTNKANAAISFVKSKSVNAKDITTQGYNVEPRYQYYNCDQDDTVCPPYEITGYTITQSILVKVRDFDVIGDLLSGVVQNGANTVSQLSFTVEDPAELENQAREKAITKAKDKAKSIAKAGGFRLGKLLSINEGSYYPMPMFSAAEGKGGGAPTPTIEPGSYDITINVTLTYEIK
ncbi:MAG: SIMPL domain-containing protein [bacterium]|nr:SIMPL domain-containing protein [bacterium]